MPVMQLVIYGYAVNLDVKNIPLCVYDRDATQTSQDLLKRFQATDYFRIVHVADNYPDVLRQIDSGNATAAIVIPPQFDETLSLGRQSQRAIAHRRERQQLRQRGHGLRASHHPAYSSKSPSIGSSTTACRRLRPTSPSSRAPGSTRTSRAWPTSCPASWRW